MNKIYILNGIQVVLFLNHELPEGAVVIDKDLLCSAVDFNSLKNFNGECDLREIVNDFIRVGDKNIEDRKELRRCFAFKTDFEIDYIKRNYTVYTDSSYEWVSILTKFKDSLLWADDNLKNLTASDARILIIQSLYNFIKDWEEARDKYMKEHDVNIPDYVEVYNYKPKKEEN